MNIDPGQHTRDRYVMVLPITTRWNDYDMLGHVNNVLYNRYVEITVLELVKRAGVNWLTDRAIPFAAEVCVKFLRPLRFAEHVDAALRVGKLGTTSVVYEVALFMPDEDAPAAVAHFVHVFVDRGDERPVPIPAPVRRVFEKYRA